MITKKILADTQAINSGITLEKDINVFVPSDFENMIRNIIDKHPSSDVTATVIGIEKVEKELKIWQTTAVSESTYYRLKKQIIDKIYNLYILAGDVRLDEILAEKIE